MTLPQDISDEIRANLQWQEEGWGRMKAKVTLRKITWDTSIWFDSKGGGYVLPIKAQIRKSLKLVEGDELSVELFL